MSCYLGTSASGSGESLHCFLVGVNKSCVKNRVRPQKPYGLLGTGRRGRGKGGMEMEWGWGGEGDYIPIATLSPPE